MEFDATVSRRDVLKGSGALVVAVVAPRALSQAPAGDGQQGPFWRELSPAQLDTYLAIDEQGLVTAYFGKMDMGQGVDLSIAQIVAEELHMALDDVAVVMGDTALTVNQGGASGSTGLEQGAKPLRNAAAEARRVLSELGARHLGLLMSQVGSQGGAVYALDDPTQRVSYGELLGGQHFDVKLEWNGRFGNTLDARGRETPKPSSIYETVGKPFQRRDLPGIVMGTRDYIVDVRLPGMLHGRVVRPPVAGSVPANFDSDSIAHIPGARVVHEGDYLGVVAEREWDAIKAARELDVTWTDVDAPFPEMASLYDHIREAPVVRESAGGGRAADVAPDLESFDAALARANRVIEAEYEFPFQSHASMAPACAVCDFRGDHAILWTGSQKPHYAAQGVAQLLGLPVENVRGIWVPGPGSYGRNDAGDAAMDAALMSKAAGRPVRVQGMRDEGSGWDPKGPASIHHVRASFDAAGNVTAYCFRSKGFSAGDTESNESNPSHTYAGMLTGWPDASVQRFNNPGDRYEFPNKVQYWQTIAPLLGRASPLRTAHLRDPLGPQIHFASESFVDEMAHAVNTDPIEFRLRYLEEQRDADVLRAAAERYAWQPRVAATREIRSGDVATGRGVAYTRRNNSVVAVIAEVDVNLRTGRVWPRRFVVAADQGIVVNPLWLRRTLEGNVIHGMSRTLHEEVRFSRERVTSIDWLSYPILEMADAPEEIDIVLVNRPELPPYGAGEPSTRTITPAIANAIFDATGVRLRRAPFTAERMLEALEAAAT
ncbi:MAG: molybdopterin-dependent oxidoreductase [Gammaproteobacteria bacterium]|nr:molybdopterin-dependent oxidoreductase [Gammaproteobacteria bacterium]